MRKNLLVQFSWTSFGLHFLFFGRFILGLLFTGFSFLDTIFIDNVDPFIFFGRSQWVLVGDFPYSSGEQLEFPQITTYLLGLPLFFISNSNLDNFSLSEGTTYYFVVRAYNAFGEIGDSNVTTYAVPSAGDTTPPIPPEGISISICIVKQNIFILNKIFLNTTHTFGDIS